MGFQLESSIAEQNIQQLMKRTANRKTITETTNKHQIT